MIYRMDSVVSLYHDFGIGSDESSKPDVVYKPRGTTTTDPRLEEPAEHDGGNNKATPARVLLVWLLVVHAAAFGLVSTFVVPCRNKSHLFVCNIRSFVSGDGPVSDDHAARLGLYEHARRGSAVTGNKDAPAPQRLIFAAGSGWARLPPVSKCVGMSGSNSSRAGPDVRSCSTCCECRLITQVQRALAQRISSTTAEPGGHYLSKEALADIRDRVLLGSIDIPETPQDISPPEPMILDNLHHHAANSTPRPVGRNGPTADVQHFNLSGSAGDTAGADMMVQGSLRPMTGYLTWSPQALNNRDLSGLPACDVCAGCSTIFTPMPSTTRAFGHSFALGTGASHAAVVTTTSLRAQGGVGVAKLFCSSDGSLVDRHGSERSRCFQKKSQHMFAKVLAISRLAEEMELNTEHSFIPPTWVERANGVLPSGMRVNWDVMVSDFVPSGSVSVGALVSQHPSTSGVLEILGNVPSQDVLQAAVFDLLFSVCDRHSSNVFVGKGSRLTLIDHDMLTMNDTWRPCGVSSLFLPTTRKFEELIHGASYVRGKEPGAMPQRSLSPQMLLDYRCHTPGGRIGTDFPAKTRQTMERLQDMPIAEVMERYGFLDRNNAMSLRARARSMLRHGFEHVLEHMAGNEADHVYPWQPSCCQMSAGFSLVGNGLVCTHKWTPLVTPNNIGEKAETPISRL